MYMRPESRVFQFASYTFDASIMEVLSTLITGGCICIPNEDDRLNDIAGCIKKFLVTWTLLTPSVANVLSPKDVSSLKVLVTGGEAMSPGHIEKWKGQVALLNAYGPSETSVIASVSTKIDEDGNEINGDASNIGRAVGGRNWVVDPQDYTKLRPVGCIGELLVEGSTVARGYLNNEQKTANAFISDPPWLTGVKGRERIYRTGDLVRQNSDGSFCFVARKDTQIKLNGQRIEVLEIEHQVKANLPENSQAAVELVSPPGRLSSKALAVFFCFDAFESRPISDVDEILIPMSDAPRTFSKTLDSSLAKVLPKYMIPTFYIPIQSMPWTSSGKLDRGRLRKIVEKLPVDSVPPYRLASSVNKRAPKTENEKILQALWATTLNLLNISLVGVEDSFFRLGGDSLAAIRLAGAARAKGISLSVIDIFRNPILSNMATFCCPLNEDPESKYKALSLLPRHTAYKPLVDEVADQCQIKQHQIQDMYPSSFLQEGLITLSIKQPGAYVAHNAFKLPLKIDLDRFKFAWQKTVDELDILRTRIVHTKSSIFIQVVLRAHPILWHTADDFEEINIEELYTPEFNGGPLTRYTLVGTESSTQRYFLFSIHHSLYDGWSLPMVLKRVEMIYLNDSPIPPTVHYASFIKYLSEVDTKSSESFWKENLSEALPLQFPQIQHSDATHERKSRTFKHSTPISRDTTGMDYTISTAIRAAWSMIIAAYSGSNDVVFGETLTGRDIPVPGVTDIVGPIFTTIPIRVQVDRGVKVRDFLDQIHQNYLSIIPHQHFGLQKIKHLDENAAVACEFQNLLVIQSVEEDTDSGFWDLQAEEMVSNFFTYPLVIECNSSTGKIDIQAHFDQSVISDWQVQRLLFQFGSVIEQLSSPSKLGKNAKLGDVELLSSSDKEIIRRSNKNEPLLIDERLHDLIEEIAISQPDAPAINAFDGELTYKGLWEHANRLAQFLVALGVGPEVLVPICMDKSVWTIVSILAILMSKSSVIYS